MTRVTLLDSCVLYPAPLRDLLVRLGGAGLIRVRWTNEIHEEWIRSVLESRSDLSRVRLERTRDLMNQHVLDALITDYAARIPGIRLPDPGDRHVVAAAIEGGVDEIVTFNLRDFPDHILAEWNLVAIHPDELIEALLDADCERVCATLRQQREDLRRPPVSVDEFVDTLARQGLERTAARLEQIADSL